MVSFICGTLKIQQTSKHNKKETDSLIHRIKLGQLKGRGLSSTNYDVENKLQGYIVQYREYSKYFIITRL